MMIMSAILIIRKTRDASNVTGKQPILYYRTYVISRKKKKKKKKKKYKHSNNLWLDNSKKTKTCCLVKNTMHCIVQTQTYTINRTS